MSDPAAPLPREPERLTLADDSTIAYHALKGKSPGVLFLGGFQSDMTGTKATALDAFCRASGHAYTRFDYTGHGASSGRFIDGTIGRWAEDAIAVLDRLTEGPQILVGSSMGGWLMLLAALARPERLHGLVGVAAAPDFTEDLLWQGLDDAARGVLERQGVLYMPSEYDDEPYPITRTLIEEGREHLVMRGPIAITCPVRLLHGMKDNEVPWQTALKLSDRLESRDVSVRLIKDGDHRLSSEVHLKRLCAAVDELAVHEGAVAATD